MGMCAKFSQQSIRQLLRYPDLSGGPTNRPRSRAASMAKKAWRPVFQGPCCEYIHYFCGIATEITSAYRSHFTFRWSGPGCKGQLSESLYPLRPTGGLLDHDWLQRAAQRLERYVLLKNTRLQQCWGKRNVRQPHWYPALYYKLRFQASFFANDKILLNLWRMLHIAAKVKYWLEIMPWKEKHILTWRAKSLL